MRGVLLQEEPDLASVHSRHRCRSEIQLREATASEAGPSAVGERFLDFRDGAQRAFCARSSSLYVRHDPRDGSSQLIRCVISIGRVQELRVDCRFQISKADIVLGLRHILLHWPSGGERARITLRAENQHVSRERTDADILRNGRIAIIDRVHHDR